MRSGYYIARMIAKEGCGLMESSERKGKRWDLAKIMEMSSAQQNKGVWMEGLPRYYGNEGEPVPSKNYGGSIL